MDLVVMTCDAYQDTWEAFFKLKDKYWDCKYDTYLVTETKDCPYSKTIKTTGAWTKRLREALEQLDNEYVIFMLDDFFLRSKVDQERIDGIIKHFDSNTAVFNTERYNLSKTTEKSVYGFKNRQNKQMYLCSCQPSIWNREKLISLLQQDMTPWEWETQILDSEYKFYINKGDTIFDIGYYEDKKPWAIVQGKWATECRELFKKEKIKVDFYERGFLDMKLSIIIPYRDTYDMACKLLDKLTKQATKDVEIILIDDGCNEDWSKYDIRVINKEQTKWRSASPGRNMGLDIAQGKYIAFIDADDMVVDNYIETVLNKCNEDFDYCYMSWKDSKGKKVIIDNEPPEWNQSVWNGIYKRETIGKHRFKETTQYGEELDFILKVRRGVKGTPILGPIYIYNVGVEGGLTDLFCKGLIDREAPLTAQVVMYLRFISKLGGVETFVYEWIKRFHKEHDILFLYDEADPQQLLRLRQMVKCQIYKGEKVECETYLNVNFNKNIADNVKAKLYLDMCHTDYDAMGWQYTTHPKTDITLCVSKVVEKALKKQYPKLKTEVVPNLLEQPKPKRTLFLVSATRLSWEKGYWRMKEFAKRLNERKIPFTWLVFTNDLPDEEIDGFVFMKPRLNVLDFVARADYLVQLSNTEADPYSPKEALSVGTPIITTNYPSTYETGMEVGKNGYVLDMELENLDEVIENMYKHTLKPKPMTNDYDTAWLKHLGKKTKSSYKYDKNEKIEDILEDIWIAKRRLKDDEGKIVKKGEVAKLYSSQRIRQLLEYNMIERKVT